ncbi:uncharacterized protein LOC117338061 [Pecten maximus]|uniref:uncharacterized protein LOC117338061 n=1 Tax=Pecten maximus TaxID=6579 RepID=UPI0014583940|nr:uncharacterized protein LOC117338061 [Pecten maximus]
MGYVMGTSRHNLVTCIFMATKNYRAVKSREVLLAPNSKFWQNYPKETYYFIRYPSKDMSRRKQKRLGDNQDIQEYFHKRRFVRPEPDPDVYNWPKEWLPKPATPLVPANTSALRIDPPKSKPPYHVFENTFYLQSPPKMRSELEPWKLDFDYNPEIEMARLKKIKKTEKELLDRVSGHRRSHIEKMAIKKEAEEIVDTEEYRERTEIYAERKKKDMEIMRRVYRERDLGEPPHTYNIAEMAMDLKHKVYFKSMKNLHPGYTHTKTNQSDQGDMDFTVPKDDTINDNARKTTNAIFKKSESALENNLGVDVHESEPGPSGGMHYIYEAYKEKRTCTNNDSYSQHGRGPNCMMKQPHAVTRDHGQHIPSWYGHEKHRKLEQYKKHKYEKSAGSSSSNGANQENVSLDDSINRCKENEHNNEELGKDGQSQPRMTLWYGHSQGREYDEAEAIRTMFDQNKTFSGNHDEHDQFNNGKHRYGLLCGRDKMATDADVLEGVNKQNLNEFHERKDEMVDDEEAGITFTTMVPFLYLSTEDLPHRIRTETYTYKRSPHQSIGTNSQDLQNSRCIIL